MITDDLAPLFGGSGGPGVRFRQGRILAWDADTGENSVELGGATLANVPILNTGEAIALKAGHVVGMLGQGKTWFIIGRVTPPNDPNFAGASVAFASARDSAINFALPVGPGFGKFLSTTLDVPSWADEAVVTCAVSASFMNKTTDPDFAFMYAAVDEFTSGAVATGVQPIAGGVADYYASLTHVHTEQLFDLGATIEVSGHIQAQGDTWPADPANQGFLAATAIFKSNV
jgi:hypothetical protein